MLFQIYGDTALWQLLGWALVFTGLVRPPLQGRRHFLFPGASGCTERVLYRHQCGGRKGC